MSGNQTIVELPPNSPNLFYTAEQDFLKNELPQVLHRYVPSDFVTLGGIHSTSTTMVSPMFALEGFTNAGNRVTADGAGGVVSINYGLDNLGVNHISDTCWVIASAQAVPTIASSNFQRVTNTFLYVDASSTSQPALPNDCIYLMKVTITNGQITAVVDLRKPSSVVVLGFYSFDDPLYVNPQEAIYAALTADQPLFISGGVHVVETSLANLHDITLTGPGIIQRGSDTFMPNPTETHTNIFYVGPLGLDTNDGLTSDFPFFTLQTALNVLSHYDPPLKGNWIIQLLAGTYVESVVYPAVLQNHNRVTIRGPIVNSPNIPTAILDGAGTLATGLAFNSQAYALISNIKFQNYTTNGLVGQDFVDIFCVNTHAANVTSGPGIKAQQGRLRVSGGIITACQEGVIAIGNTVYTISDGCQILDCTQAGVLVQENSDGHIDNTTIANCAVGVDLIVQSRAHIFSCIISNNATAGVRARGSEWLDDGNIFSGNATNFLNYAYAYEINHEGSRTNELRQAIDLTFQTFNGVITTQVVRTYANAIFANSFDSVLKAYRVLIYGRIDGTTDLKTVVVNIGGSPGWGHALPADLEGDFVWEGMFYCFSTDGMQQSFWSKFICAQYTDIQTGSRGISMLTGSDIPMEILLTINSAADSISIRGVDQYNIGGS